MALTASAHSLTFEDGYNEGWAELNGPQFLLPWSAEDLATIRRALDHMKEEHLQLGRFDDYQMGRRARFVEKLDTHAGIVLGGDGSVLRWVSLLELDTVGRSVSRDRYRVAPMEEPEEQTLVARIMNWFSMNAFAREVVVVAPKMVPRLDGLAENVDCYIKNVAAIKLYDKLAAARHSTPGGVY